MSNKKVWFTTGAVRGMAVDCAEEALAAGHQLLPRAVTATIPLTG